MHEFEIGGHTIGEEELALMEAQAKALGVCEYGFKKTMPLCASMDTHDKPILELAESICASISDRNDARVNMNKLIHAAKIVICNLIVSFETQKTVLYSRSRKHSFNEILKRYNVSVVNVNRVIDYLASIDLILSCKGYYDKKGFGHSSKLSSFNTTDSFVEFAKSKHLSADHVFRKREFIFVKDKNKNQVNVQKNRTFKTLERPIAHINEFIRKQIIRLKVPEHCINSFNAHEQHPDRSISTLYRVFNEGAYSKGGRLYGHWVQALPKKLRQHVTINGKEITEIDFVSFHINLLYAIERPDMPLPGDCYDIGIKGIDRTLIKKLMLICIDGNEMSIGQVKSSLNYEGFKIDTVQTQSLFSKILDCHKPISHMFFKGNSHWLQNLDSKIAVEIIMRLSQKSIPCIPIHDSFILPKDKIDESLSVIEQVSEEITGKVLPTKIET